ncbi:MAG: DNA topoisomerase 3 [Tissierellia bacterium]|nr:DNA topoisomerase 3 [Tissierellia bacterium]
MKKLILAEKPSVAKDMAGALSVPAKGRYQFENNKYIIVWALGHLVTLATPEEYSKKYKDWNMKDLPMIPKKKKLVIIPKTKGHFYGVKKQLERKDVSEIIIATDAGREGELVARWIIEMAGVRKPLRRLWISSVTKKAIIEGFQTLKPGKDYENLYHSAESRAMADWLVGFNGTRALTVKYNASLSCGRVQTPTLEMLYQREQKIGRFRPEKYYLIDIKTNLGTFQVKGGRNFNEKSHKKNLELCKSEEIIITGINRKKKKIYPQPLYDLTALQRDGNEKFGFSTKETQNAMQNLYERFKVLTYPRTDSRYLTKDIIPTLGERLDAMAVGKYASIIRPMKKDSFKGLNRIVKDSAVTDHHAIIPTEEPVFLQDFNDKERKIYDLVASRFLSHFMPPTEIEELKLEGRIGTLEVELKTNRVLEPGFQILYGEQKSTKDFQVPKTGETIKVIGVQEKIEMTTPPPYFTEGTLLGAMENPISYIKKDSQKTRELLKEGGGIGTVATRSDIIEKLYQSDYMEKRGQYLHLTGKGRQLLDLVPNDLRAPDMTAKWEGELRAIERGKESQDKFLKRIEAFTKEVVEEIKTDSKKYIHQNLSGKSCPECGKPTLLVNRKGREMELCSDRNCNYRKTISQVTNARCPQCKKKMTLFGEGEGRFFRCICGHRESYEVFNKRREQRKNQMSKHEVRKYLNKQEDKGDINTSLADALKGLDL